MPHRNTATGRQGPSHPQPRNEPLLPLAIVRSAPDSGTAADWTPQSDASAWDDILSRGAIDVHFQPILSLKQKSIIGLEALARPVDGRTGRAIPPLDLFAWAAAHGRTVALDRLCRRQALAGFAPLAGGPQAPLLFLNFESSVLDQGVLGSGVLSKAVRDAGLSPGQIVVEINESKVSDAAALARFVEVHRDQGFLFALDDLGTGFSNLARIGLLKPEILKLDRSLVVGIGTDFHKQELCKSLVGLGRRVGSLILAEGVETEEELSTCVDLGADLLQGFYFGRPAAAARLSLAALDAHLAETAEKQRKRSAESLARQRTGKLARMELMLKLVAETALVSASGFAAVLARVAGLAPEIECLYVLDPEGAQVTPTVTAQAATAKVRSRLFQPATQGADHSTKEYFYALAEGGHRLYATEPYLSLASGGLCRTLSCHFQDVDGHGFILCLDIAVA
jgi:EAL domain-containing protein (putative c-di-GMP-specific phosphodiesterase class I)